MCWRVTIPWRVPSDAVPVLDRLWLFVSKNEWQNHGGQNHETLEARVFIILPSSFCHPAASSKNRLSSFRTWIWANPDWCYHTGPTRKRVVVPPFFLYSWVRRDRFLTCAGLLTRLISSTYLFESVSQAGFVTANEVPRSFGFRACGQGFRLGQPSPLGGSGHE